MLNENFNKIFESNSSEESLNLFYNKEEIAAYIEIGKSLQVI